MYNYEKILDIDPQQLLQKITQQQIFEFILKLPLNYDNRYVSPFRQDKKPDCRFQERDDGTILFIDFGEKFLTGHTHRSCFMMVMDAYNVNMTSAITIICNHFELSTNLSDYLPVATFGYQSSGEISSHVELSYRPKPITRLDIGYWSQFLIRPEHLEEDGTYPVKNFTLVKSDKRRTVTVYKYCYAFDFINQHKIYQPYSEKYKFISSCDENCIGNINNLPKSGEELIIQKSYKDYRVIRNTLEGSNVIWFQNEGCVPDLFILKNLVNRFRLLTFFYDNDEAGILAAMKLVNICNSLRQDSSRLIHLPLFLSKSLNYKDPSEFINKEGKKDLITILKQIGL